MRLIALQRPVLGGLVLVLVASALTGCSWFRREPAYLAATESRPLEVPPDLVLPSSAGALQIPPAPAGQIAPGETPPAITATAAGAFSLSDSSEGAFQRISLALQRINGVESSTAVSALNAFEVRFGGETFLIRLTPQGEQIQVDAISTDGRLLASPAARNLLSALRNRLQ